ncbi:hypothetical protein AB0H86_01365 [Streptomyces sp. NPDC050997]|uniref:hypothetical protein n=1 Tax=Streptomyces sp. NPDC050997 TaxID=3155519 RepID=UPI0034193E09
MKKRMWIAAALTAVAVASGIEVAAYGAPEEPGAGFPSGHFKIKNEKTGECVQAFLGQESDTFGDGSKNPNAGRYIQGAALQPCVNTKDQEWKYDATRKQLESLGVDGDRCLALNQNINFGGLGNILGTSEQPGEKPGWNLSFGWCGEASSEPLRSFKFQTDKGLIWSASAHEHAPTNSSYLTAAEEGRVIGMTQGQAGQEWTFPAIP